MALRWKQPIELNQQGKGGQEAYDAAYAARMEALHNPAVTEIDGAAAAGIGGYVPNMAGGMYTQGTQSHDASSSMMGYYPVPSWNKPGSGEGYRFDSREIIKTRISELESELSFVNARIAEIDKATPELAGNRKEWEIAAKRAEIGDMSAYDNLMSRGNSDSVSASGIENELYNAEKLTWGLHSKSDEDIAIAKANIEASLRRAEEWASRTGKELPSSYFRLRKELDDVESGMNAREYANDLALKIYRGTATDADIEKGVEWAENNKNSDAAKAILEAAEAAKGKTKEARARAAARKNAAREKILELQKLPLDKQGTAYDALDQEMKDAILEQAQWDEEGDKGLVWRR